MFIDAFYAGNIVPNEYKKAAESLFKKDPTVEVLEAYADSLGIKLEYHKNFDLENDYEQLLRHFQKNLSLLIAKTWVEKADEVRKEKLQVKIPAFIEKVKEKNYADALKDFSQMLEELSFLIFGNQCKSEDLIAYAFRIDMQLGLFCCYGKRISRISGGESSDVLRAFLILGICYLNSL